jgi:hypothetical protein
MHNPLPPKTPIAMAQNYPDAVSLTSADKIWAMLYQNLPPYMFFGMMKQGAYNKNRCPRCFLYAVCTKTTGESYIDHYEVSVLHPQISIPFKRLYNTPSTKKELRTLGEKTLTLHLVVDGNIAVPIIRIDAHGVFYVQCVLFAFCHHWSQNFS